MSKNAEKLLDTYLRESTLLQLAVSDGNKPWVCSLYYVADNDYSLYWLSFPERKHSQLIEGNPNAAICIAVKADVPVVGIQATGRAEVVHDDTTIERIMDAYVEKYNVGEKFFANYMAGKNHHVLYRFVPDEYKLFDEHDFPDEPEQIFRVEE